MLCARVWEEHRQQISCKQVETWRSAGLLPDNFRHALGRGRGKASWLHSGAVRIAAELGRHSRPGRRLNESVLRAFTADPIVFAGGRPERHPITGVGVPFLPERGVRAALEWEAAKERPGDTIARLLSEGLSFDAALDASNADVDRVARECARILARRRRSLGDRRAQPEQEDVVAAIAQIMVDRAGGLGLPSESVVESGDTLARAMGGGRPAAEVEQTRRLIIADELAGRLVVTGDGGRTMGANERVLALRGRAYRDICEVASVMHFVARTVRNRRIALDYLPQSALVRRTAVLYATDPWLHWWITGLEHVIGLQGPDNWRGMTTAVTGICLRANGLEQARRLASMLEYCYGDASVAQVELELGRRLVARFSPDVGAP